MKTRRIIYSLMVLALVAIFASGCHPRRFSDDFPQSMLEHIDDYVEDLQLTADQEDQYQNIRARLEADLIKQKAVHKNFKTSMQATINQESNGVKEITAQLRTKVKDLPDIATLYLDYIDEFYDILDDQQKTMIMDEVRTNANRRMFRD
jgi:hypothetical protein